MVSPEFEAHIKIGSERTYTSQVGFVRSALFVFFGLLNLIAALLEWFFPALPFLPHPVVSVVFSLPLFLYASVYSWIRSFNKLTLCSAGIRWRYHEILWSEILSIKESNHGLLTLEVEEKQGLVRIPLAGMQSLDEIRKIISHHVKYKSLVLPISSPSIRAIFFSLAGFSVESALFFVLVKLMQSYAAQPLGLPDISHYGITYAALIVSIGSIIIPYHKSRISLSESITVTDFGIGERALVFINTTISYQKVVSLHKVPETSEHTQSLKVKSQNREIMIDSHFPNYPQVVEEICRRTGLEVQDV